MTLRVSYHPAVVKEDLPQIPRNIRQRIRKAIEVRLFVDPVRAGAPLRRDLKGYRKMRVGDCRIIYRVESDKILVLIIGHRKEVYRRVFNRD